MAVWNKCCYCGVRSGSIASAVYSLVLACIGLAYFGYSAGVYHAVKSTLAQAGLYHIIRIFDAFYAVYIIACIVFVFMIIACIFVFVGVRQDNKGMLIPFMVAQGLHFLWYFIYSVVNTAALAQISGISQISELVYLVTIIILVPFFIGDLVCLLCVISQYQEYCDGRGRDLDQPGPSTTTTVIV